MSTKLSAAIVAMSLVVVSQSASAETVKGVAVEIAKVSPASGPVQASVKSKSGFVWMFSKSRGFAATSATVNGAKVDASALKVGMTCVVYGETTSLSMGTLSKIDCKPV